MADMVITPRAEYVALLDAIREKGGTSALMTTPEATAAVEAIETGGGDIDGIGLLARTIESIDSSEATVVGQLACRACTHLLSVNLPNVATIGSECFSGCTSLTTVSMPKVKYVAAQAFNGCTQLLWENINMPDITSCSSSSFSGCIGLTGNLVFKKMTQGGGSNVFNGCTNVTGFDFPVLTKVNGGMFQNCSKFAVLVLRSSTRAALDEIRAFNGTPFASGGTGGTLYVPSALIASYQSATNWSTILGYTNNSIQAIEGSIYETQYADGTPIT